MTGSEADTGQLSGGHILLFVSRVPAFGAVGAVDGGDGVDRGALFAGGMRGLGGVGEAGSGLARVVVKLHQAEDQVGGHQLKRVGRVSYHIAREEEEPGREQLYETIDL